MIIQICILKILTSNDLGWAGSHWNNKPAYVLVNLQVHAESGRLKSRTDYKTDRQPTAGVQIQIVFSEKLNPTIKSEHKSNNSL